MLYDACFECLPPLVRLGLVAGGIVEIYKPLQILDEVNSGVKGHLCLAVFHSLVAPEQERLMGDLFERYAEVGAVLVTYHGGEEFRVRRKTTARQTRK